MKKQQAKRRIGFVSTRLAGTDGVSLETQKWVRSLTALGHTCFFFAGESEWPEERSRITPEAHFEHELIRRLNKDLFDDYRRAPETSDIIQSMQSHLKRHLYAFVDEFDIELLIAENALTIPMNVPLGLALTQLAAETSLPVVAHHHDFYWERERFSVMAAQDYLQAAFPPTLNSITHVVINSFGQRQLGLRTGASSTLIPNVMDYESPPPEPDEYATDLREQLEIEPDGYLLLQPTRIVPRKRIEQAIELTRRLELPCRLVITHAAGDEGTDYEHHLKVYSELMGVDTIFAGHQFGHRRAAKEDGLKKCYSLADAYQQADLVTYPSTVEGFGNAFLEAVYYKRPLVMSRYEIFKTDIQPKGFEVIDFDDFIGEETVRQARRVLQDGDYVEAMTAHNYELARRHYSYSTLEERLAVLIKDCL